MDRDLQIIFSPVIIQIHTVGKPTINTGINLTKVAELEPKHYFVRSEPEPGAGARPTLASSLFHINITFMKPLP